MAIKVQKAQKKNRSGNRKKEDKKNREREDKPKITRNQIQEQQYQG